METVRVAKCSYCDMYLHEESVGEPCYAGCEREDGSSRRLRLRVGYICRDCYEEPFFGTKAALEVHRALAHPEVT